MESDDVPGKTELVPGEMYTGSLEELLAGTCSHFLCIKNDYGPALVDLKTFELIPVSEEHTTGEHRLHHLTNLRKTITLAAMASEFMMKISIMKEKEII